MCFVDNKKAFDGVPKKVMEWAIMQGVSWSIECLWTIQYESQARCVMEYPVSHNKLFRRCTII